jgi:hypothetical protein
MLFSMRDMPNFFHAQHGFYTYISCPKRDQVHKGDFFFFLLRGNKFLEVIFFLILKILDERFATQGI